MPTYPDELILVTMYHKLLNGPEQIVNTFHLQHRHYDGNTFDWPAALGTVATKVRDTWEASSVWSDFGSGVTFQWAKASQIAPDGKVTQTAVANSTVTGGKAGTNSLPMLPYEVAAVCSIRTDTPGSVVSNPRSGPNPSRQRRGRIYFGGFTTSIMDAGGGGDFDPTWCNAFGAKLLGFFNAIQGTHVGGLVAPNTNFDYVKFGVASGVSGQFYQADRIIVDRVPDAQRRRRNRQKIAGYTGTVAHSE